MEEVTENVEWEDKGFWDLRERRWCIGERKQNNKSYYVVGRGSNKNNFLVFKGHSNFYVVQYLLLHCTKRNFCSICTM